MKLAIVSPKIEAKSCHSDVLPARVAAYLRYGVLGENVDADDYHEDAAYHAQQGVVLFDLGLEHRVKKQRRHGHEGVAQATPRPETIPERRLFDRVRWMHSTATGPTVIDAATPTQMPRNITSKISNPIFFGCGVSGNKDTKNLGHPSRPREKRARSIVGNGRYVDKISKTLAAELYIGSRKSVNLQKQQAGLWQK